ncbi:RsmB/NOP family class I SAM-dependent RNA methyltransferase [Aureimonas sp. SA4125]|uniref:RsmB/NOP family class I SAM-dependent RNA methyltransferase n=1 Tax=Aureimonas sp. SA4125 TaxID=2826993 RepID=UPI001CC461CE|nr:RsmB/NOP family class I SAM-dependent RNA methyltransferase [Aureimonas sp. SA4125]
MSADTPRRGGNFDATRSAPRKKPLPGKAPAARPAAHDTYVQDGYSAGDRPGLGARLVAAKLLSAIVDAKTSADGLLDGGNGHPGFRALEGRDQGLVKAIILTALRFRGTIERAIDRCLDRPLPPNAVALRHILHVGAAQVLYLDVPDSAAVDLAVAACAVDSRSQRFGGMVNAVLRRLSREKESLKLVSKPGENVPEWLMQKLVGAYGKERALAIAAAHLTPAPLDITVKSDAAGWAEKLGGVMLPTGTVRLGAFDGPVTALPGFAEGAWWVQDAAAALPARLFGDVAGLRVADLCAAPGGKTAQLASAGARVTALDINANRMKRLQENLGRLQLDVETVVTDLARYVPETPFDAVLLDSPCSSTGTVRRHPDVAYTKDDAEVEKLAEVQARLLGEAARLVRAGGILVFSNCSLDPREGEIVVAEFLAVHADFGVDPIRPEELPGLEAAIDAKGMLRTAPDLLPAEDPRLAGLDGFFAARLRKL